MTHLERTPSDWIVLEMADGSGGIRVVATRSDGFCRVAATRGTAAAAAARAAEMIAEIAEAVGGRRLA